VFRSASLDRQPRRRLTPCPVAGVSISATVSKAVGAISGAAGNALASPVQASSANDGDLLLDEEANGLNAAFCLPWSGIRQKTPPLRNEGTRSLFHLSIEV
jgi:hypothetical protein